MGSRVHLRDEEYISQLSERNECTKQLVKSHDTLSIHIVKKSALRKAKKLTNRTYTNFPIELV